MHGASLSAALLAEIDDEVAALEAEMKQVQASAAAYAAEGPAPGTVISLQVEIDALEQCRAAGRKLPEEPQRSPGRAAVEPAGIRHGSTHIVRAEPFRWALPVHPARRQRLSLRPPEQVTTA